MVSKEKISESSDGLFQSKSLNEQSWPYCKIGPGQPKVIIFTNFVGFKSFLLCALFQGHLTYGSGEEVFKGFLIYMGMAAILVM